MKLCKDCVWGQPGQRPEPEFWRCANPQFAKAATGIDYVTGQPRPPRKPYALDTRDDPDACGPDAKAWEARGGASERGFGSS
jgi:hypothetical protein